MSSWSHWSNTSLYLSTSEIRYHHDICLFQQNWYSETPVVMNADDKSNERRCLMSEGLVASANSKAVTMLSCSPRHSTVDHVDIGFSTSWFLRRYTLICPSSIDTDHWFVTERFFCSWCQILTIWNNRSRLRRRIWEGVCYFVMNIVSVNEYLQLKHGRLTVWNLGWIFGI